MRVLRAVGHGLLGVALLASLLSICPCAPMAEANHGCCDPAAGWSAAREECCAGARDSVPRTLTESAPPVAVALSACVQAAACDAAAHAPAGSTAHAHAAHAAAPLVLRI